MKSPASIAYAKNFDFWTDYRRFIISVAGIVLFLFLIDDYFVFKILYANLISLLMALYSGQYVVPYIDPGNHVVLLASFQLTRSCTEIHLIGFVLSCILCTPMKKPLNIRLRKKSKAFLASFLFLFITNCVRISLQLSATTFWNVDFILVHNSYISIGTDLLFFYLSYRIAVKILPEFEQIYVAKLGWSTLVLIFLMIVYFWLTEPSIGIGDFSILGLLFGY